MTDDPIEAAAAENAERAPGAAAPPAGRLEANEVDTLEQALGLGTEETDEEEPQAAPPIEVDPADAAEQRRAVPLDEDDYR